MNSFHDPLKIAALLADFHREWFICGGWAIDLFLNRVTRPHKDVDIAVLRHDQFAIRTYLTQRGWTLDKAIEGQLVVWAEKEWLELPVHTVWCKTPNAEPNFLELLCNEATLSHFLFRRDQSITLLRRQMSVQSASGLRLLAPEIVLLYKADNPDLLHNESDFQQVRGELPATSRQWLFAAITKLYPNHRWLREI